MTAEYIHQDGGRASALRRLRFAALCALAGAATVGVVAADEAGEAHQAPHAAVANSPLSKEPASSEPAVPLEINEALRGSREALATSNMVDGKALDSKLRQLELQTRLDAARRLKEQRSYSDAERLLAGLLETDAPEDLHRTVLLEMALLAEEQGLSARAQQIFSQFVAKYPDDASVPEVLLRQGLLYRRMGAASMALAKFYGVMTTSLRLRPDQMAYYQRLVLQAQTEIAETYYLQGNHKDAVEFLARLMKLDNPELNKPQILYKLIRSLAGLEQPEEVVLQAEAFLHQYPEAPELSEVRFLMAKAFQKLRRPAEAKQQVLALLEAQQSVAAVRPDDWRHWQLRAGNEIANLLYLEGDYVHALQIYRTLADLNPAPEWQLPAWYQMALVYERLQQPQEATKLYSRIVSRGADIEVPAGGPALEEVVRMAQWRMDFLGWQADAGRAADPLSGPSPSASHALAQ